MANYFLKQAQPTQVIQLSSEVILGNDQVGLKTGPRFVHSCECCSRQCIRADVHSSIDVYTGPKSLQSGKCRRARASRVASTRAVVRGMLSSHVPPPPPASSRLRLPKAMPQAANRIKPQRRSQRSCKPWGGAGRSRADEAASALTPADEGLNALQPSDEDSSAWTRALSQIEHSWCYGVVPPPCWAAGPPPSETVWTFLYFSSRARCISKSACRSRFRRCCS